jgi:hypothetical protein
VGTSPQGDPGAFVSSWLAQVGQKGKRCQERIGRLPRDQFESRMGFFRTDPGGVAHRELLRQDRLQLRTRFDRWARTFDPILHRRLFPVWGRDHQKAVVGLRGTQPCGEPTLFDGDPREILHGASAGVQHPQTSATFPDPDLAEFASQHFDPVVGPPAQGPGEGIQESVEDSVHFPNDSITLSGSTFASSP